MLKMFKANKADIELRKVSTSLEHRQSFCCVKIISVVSKQKLRFSANLIGLFLGMPCLPYIIP